MCQSYAHKTLLKEIFAIIDAEMRNIIIQLEQDNVDLTKVTGL